MINSFTLPLKGASEDVPVNSAKDALSDTVFYSVPTEIVIGIFQYLDRQTLGRTSLVCHFWKQLTDDQLAWQGAFLQTRNESFIPNACLLFKNMLSFESCLMQLFKSKLTKLSEEKFDYLVSFAKTRAIKIEDLETGICSIDNQWKSNPYYIRLNKKMIDLYLSSNDERQDSLISLVQEIFSTHIHWQEVLEAGDQQTIILENFQQPTVRIKQIIKRYDIVDVFKLNNGITVILAKQALNKDDMTSLSLTDKDVKKQIALRKRRENNKMNEELIQKFVTLSKDLNTNKLICKFNDRIKIGQEPILTVIRQRIVSPQTGMKKFLTQYFNNKQAVILERMIDKYFQDVWDRN